MTARHFFAGLDFGRNHDQTALAILERLVIPLNRTDPVTWQRLTETRFAFRHLERLPRGTPYTETVSLLRHRLAHPDLAGSSTLVLDATAVSSPVLELIRAARLRCRIIPVVITSADAPSSAQGLYRVPKRDLIVGLQLLLETRAISISARSPEAESLVRELTHMRLHLSPSGHDSYSSHDGLLIAAALASWRARPRPTNGLPR